MNDIYDNLTKEQLIGLQKQIRWERDVAIEQLHQIGKEFGEKMDDVHKVVFCKDCKYKVETEDGEWNPEDIVCDYWASDGLEADDFCSRGELK